MSLEFQSGQSLPSDGRYKILDKSHRTRGKARPLGRGNVGIVYLAEYKGLYRAIKFLSPKGIDQGGDRQAQIALDLLEFEFDKEKTLLSTITHTGISKIVDFGTEVSNGKSYPYYVMDFIEGESLDDFWKNCSVKDFLAVIDQVLDALAYLHTQDYYHMDVKEENIRVQVLQGSRPRAILLDLGGAKKASTPNRSRSSLREDTIYISTDKATRQERRDFIGKPISRSKLVEWSTDLDLYAVGAMLGRALEDPDAGLEKKIIEELTKSGLDALRWVISRLVSGGSDIPIEARYYRSATQLRADLDRLLPQYTWPLGLPELSVVVAPQSIQLPGQRVGLTDRLLEVVNHPLFQRLHGIPQLEYIYLIYPGARKSRLEHSLATFHLARLFLIRLLEYPEFRMIASASYIEATLLLALLHDIGHYPLSHMFEDFAPNHTASQKYTVDTVLSDEDLFQHLVSPSDSEWILSAEKAALPSGVEPLHQLLRRKFHDSYDKLGKLMKLSRDSEPPIPQLHGVLNSAIDVDKISYLRDDSSATGVRFGQGMDVDGLIDALVPPRSTDYQQAVLAITENGLAAAESIIMARFWMVSRVYWHRTNRAIMAMHKFVIADLLQAGALQFRDFVSTTLFSSQLDASRSLAKQYDAAHSAEGPQGSAVRNPLQGLIESGRDIYKRLLSINNGPDRRDREIYDAIVKEGAFGVLTVGEWLREQLARRYSIMAWRYGDVLVDIPRKRRDVLGANVVVYMDRNPSLGRNLTGNDAVSPSLRGLDDTFELNVKKCRIFVHPSIMDLLDGQGLLDDARDTVRRALEDYYSISYL